jgi:hypothetical protein
MDEELESDHPACWLKRRLSFRALPIVSSNGGAWMK